MQKCVVFSVDCAQVGVAAGAFRKEIAFSVEKSNHRRCLELFVDAVDEEAVCFGGRGQAQTLQKSTGDEGEERRRRGDRRRRN